VMGCLNIRPLVTATRGSPVGLFAWGTVPGGVGGESRVVGFRLFTLPILTQKRGWVNGT
jgi:hypothetical protein